MWAAWSIDPFVGVMCSTGCLFHAEAILHGVEIMMHVIYCKF